MQTIIKSEIFIKHAELIHGVSTKTEGVSLLSNNMSKFVGDDIKRVMKNRNEFYTQLGIDTSTAKFAHANQIHSANVAVINESGLFKETDALITNKKGVFLVISVADCLPVMIYDTGKRVIANVHSGWRGTAKGIVTNTLDKMKSEFGCDACDMVVFIGPGISKENFEVGAEVAGMFDVKYLCRPPRLARTTGAIGEPPLLAKEGTMIVSPLTRGSTRRGRGSGDEKYYIDLKSIVTDQLLSAGVNPVNIDTCPYCTFSEKNMLHSYRRDKESSGRMFAVIGLR